MISDFISVMFQIFAWLPRTLRLALGFVIVVFAISALLRLIKLILDAIPIV